MFGIFNTIVKHSFEALFARVDFYPTDALDKYPNKPWIWGHVISDEVDGSPYLTRVLLPRLPTWIPVIGGIRPFVHKFHRPDADNELHSHPWKFGISIVLGGEYIEERVVSFDAKGAPVVESRRVRWLNKLTDKDFHRVAKLKGSVYTVFLAGPKHGRDVTWEFMDRKTGKRMEWRKFLDRKVAGW